MIDTLLTYWRNPDSVFQIPYTEFLNRYYNFYSTIANITTPETVRGLAGNLQMMELQTGALIA